MLKIVVFDSGWGGEVVADYIEEEISILEVIRVIDWRNAPYAGKSTAEILQHIENALRPYWGRVQAIVLAGFIPSLVADILQSRHPDTRLVSFKLSNLHWRGSPVKKSHDIGRFPYQMSSRIR